MNIEQRWDRTEADLLDGPGSMRGLLERFRHRIPPLLVGEREWERLLERAAGLPATLGAFPFGFELPLHDTRPTADLGVSLLGGSRSAAFFADRPQSAGAEASAARITRLLDQTRPEGSSLRRVAGRKMLLEYDIPPTGGDAFPEPGIFLYPEEGMLVGDGLDRRRRDLGVVVDAVVAAAGWDVDSAERRQIERVYRALEPDTDVRAVGAFPSRSRAVRLAVAGFTGARDVVAFLKRTGWLGHRSMVDAFVSPLEARGAFRYLVVHFDVRIDGPAPSLGLSFYARAGQWIKEFEPWAALVDGIRATGLAVPEKLVSLAGSSCGAETLFGRSGLLVLLRGIHHVKVVLAGDRVEQVKAYTFFWLRRLRTRR